MSIDGFPVASVLIAVWLVLLTRALVSSHRKLV
jgi:hypothetical protein